MFLSQPEIDLMVAEQHRRDLAEKMAANWRPASARSRRSGPGLVARLRIQMLKRRRASRPVLKPRPVRPA